MALLAYLAIEGAGGFIRRDRLLAIFWPDSDTERARGSLRSALSNLRRGLGDAVIVSRGDDEVSLQHGLIRCDALGFLQAIQAGQYEEALGLYRGHLLEGFFISNAPDFEHWLERTRERLRLHAVEAAWLLADHHESGGDAEGAAQWAARATELAADDEDAVYRQIELLDRLGNRTDALKIYEGFARWLEREEAEPSPKTRALIQGVRERAEQDRHDLHRSQAAPLVARDVPAALQQEVHRAADRSPGTDTAPPDVPEESANRLEPSASMPRSGDLNSVPPESPTPTPHNLPVQLTPLVGRADEIAVVRSKLLSRDVRLLTLTGPGGIGKTRIALQAAADLLGAFKDGVYLVDFGSTADPGLVIPTIAQALGSPSAGAQPAAAQLAEYLRDKETLLVLDTFEHVLGAAYSVADLLRAAPGLKVLATSRAALQLSMENEYLIPALSFPTGTPTWSLEAVSECDSVRLFVARARAVKPEFVLSESNAATVAQICAQLDGLPLAIELAAARKKVMPPDAILARLGSKLKLLTGGARDLPARQQTLRSTLEWSYGLLSDSEQMLFRRMSAFLGGCTLDAAESVCNAKGDLGVEVLDGISALVNNSLVYSREATGEPRWAMLSTIRDYARERLEETSEADDILAEHARYFANLAEQAEPHLKGREQAQWLRRLEQEHDNLRAALRWALEPGPADEEQAPRDPATALQICAGIWRFWWTHGHLREGIRWLQQALCARGPSNSMDAGFVADARTRAEALRGAGLLTWDQGEYATARSLLEESLALSRQAGDQEGIANSLNNLGLVAQDQGHNAEARTFYEDSLAIRREIGDKRGISVSLNNLGKLACQQGRYAEARSLLEESLLLDEELGNRRGTATSLYNLGTVALAQQNYPKAGTWFQQSLDLYRATGDKRGIVECMEGIAGVALGMGQPKRTLTTLAAATALRGAIGAPPSPSEYSNREQLITAARAQLEPSSADALWAWAEGQAASMEDAITLALQTSEFSGASL